MSHDHWLESAAAYALDSLDSDARPVFESHLNGCAECRSAVQEFREVAGLLAHAPPARQAPPGLRARVADLVRADPAPAPAARPRQARPILPWLAAAACVALALTATELARRAAARVDALTAEVSRLGDDIIARDSVLEYLTGPEVHVVSLAAGNAKPVARVFWNHLRERFIVTAFDLPPARPGRTYQLWAIAHGMPPVSMGIFNTDADGNATVVLPVGDNIDALGFIDVCALTEEPTGGSLAPTETPRLSGGWRHTD